MSPLGLRNIPETEEPIYCPKCNAAGCVVWEGEGQTKALVRISGDFYERLSKRAPYPIELVCQQCGTPQLE
jgi:hypothetical protein